MTKRPTQKRIRPLSGDDSTPIIVGCTNTGLQRPSTQKILDLLTPEAIYIRHKKFSLDATVQVTNTFLKVNNVYSTGYPSPEPIKKRWSLNINMNLIVISSNDNSTVNIATTSPFTVASDSSGYFYLIFQNAMLQSAILNGVNLWTAHPNKTLEVDFVLA